GIGVGGDSVKGVRFADMLKPLLDDAATEAIMVIGEVGGTEEEEFAERLAAVHAEKPVLALIAGREAKEGIAMGHAGALTFGAMGTLRSKQDHLARAGARAFSSISELVDASVALLRERAAHPAHGPTWSFRSVIARGQRHFGRSLHGEGHTMIKAVAFLVGLCELAVPAASAQTYPSRSITLIIPFAAGGSNDIVGRTIGKKLAEAWGQPVLVDNRPGAGGVIGA